MRVHHLFDLSIVRICLEVGSRQVISFLSDKKCLAVAYNPGQNVETNVTISTK